MVPDEIKFETLVDAQSIAFQEYVSAIIAKLPKSNKEYRAIQDEIKAIYEQYPNVYGVFDTERTATLTEQECAALVKIISLQNQLVDLEIQSVYFRGCYDGAGYLKKAGIL